MAAGAVIDSLMAGRTLGTQRIRRAIAAAGGSLRLHGRNVRQTRRVQKGKEESEQQRHAPYSFKSPALLQSVWVDSDLYSKLWEHAGEDLET